MAGNSTSVVTPQAGVLEGVNPMIWSASNPITVFIVQVMVVQAASCQALLWVASGIGGAS